MSPFCNRTLELERVNEIELGGINIKFHTLGLIICAVFGLIATVLSIYLQFMHATHYLKPYEQKHIIRILFMVPVFSIVSFLSYFYYYHTVYYEVLRDCYEAFAISGFFSLLCGYVAPNLHDQKEYFRTIQPKRWVWPLRWGKWSMFKTPRSGLTWFNIVWVCIFQYCFINVFMTFVAVITQATDHYCIDSLNPAFAHVWVEVIDGTAVSVAMFCVIQFYIQLKDDIAEHRPFLKVLAIKGVIFFSFWQTIIIDFAVSSGAVSPTQTISLPDLRIGIPSMLLCIEMMLFSVLHLWAYPWQEYDVKRSLAVAAETPGGFDSSEPHPKYFGGPFGYKAFLEAYNPWDIIKAVGRAFKWMAVGRRYRLDDSSYKGRGHGAGTPLDDATTFKGNGAYQKLSDSRDQSPTRPGFEPTPAYGLGHLRTGNGPADGDLGSKGSRPYPTGVYPDAAAPPMATQTAYGGAGAHDTAYHTPDAPGMAVPMPMPDAQNYR